MAEAEAKKTDAKPAEVKPVEKQTNCPACSKPIKKKKKYYRNGKYYCGKKCYKKSLEKEKAKAA